MVRGTTTTAGMNTLQVGAVTVEPIRTLLPRGKRLPPVGQATLPAIETRQTRRARERQERKSR